MVQQTGRDTIKKLDLLKQINDAKRNAGHVKGVGDRTANKVSWPFDGGRVLHDRKSK